MLPQVTVMVAVPSATAATTPFASTVATLSLLLDHTSASVESAGFTVAVSVSVAGTLSLCSASARDAGMEISVAPSATVTSHFAVTDTVSAPCALVARIVAAPPLIAVTLPV